MLARIAHTAATLVGIILAWIVQKRWLTLGAFLLSVLAFFTLPRLPTPFSYLVLIPPVVFIVALLYEGPALGLKITKRLRLILALGMGLAVGLLIVGVVLSDSNPTVLILSVAVFAVIAMSILLGVGIAYGRQLRRERSSPADGKTERIH